DLWRDRSSLACGRNYEQATAGMTPPANDWISSEGRGRTSRGCKQGDTSKASCADQHGSALSRLRLSETFQRHAAEHDVVRLAGAEHGDFIDHHDLLRHREFARAIGLGPSEEVFARGALHVGEEDDALALACVGNGDGGVRVVRPDLQSVAFNG